MHIRVTPSQEWLYSIQPISVSKQFLNVFLRSAFYISVVIVRKKHYMAAHKINGKTQIYVATSSQYFISLFLFKNASIIWLTDNSVWTLLSLIYALTDNAVYSPPLINRPMRGPPPYWPTVTCFSMATYSSWHFYTDSVFPYFI